MSQGVLPLNTSETHSLKGLSTDLCGAFSESVAERKTKKRGRNQRAGYHHLVWYWMNNASASFLNMTLDNQHFCENLLSHFQVIFYVKSRL